MRWPIWGAYVGALGFSILSAARPDIPKWMAQWLAAFFLAFAAWGALAVALRRERPVPPPAGRGRGVLRTREFAFVLASSVLLRIFWLHPAPTLSDDVYRYRWEGRLMAAGFNPYRHPPQAMELVSLRDELWSKVNHKEVPAAYPPLAQAWGRIGVALGGGARTFQAMSAAAELLALPALAHLCAAYGLPPLTPLLYAWHPLVLAEGAGNAHHDSVAICLLLWAMVFAGRSRPVSALLLAAAALVKPLALAALPAFFVPLRGWLLLAPPLWAASYTPFVSEGDGLATAAGTYLTDGLRRYLVEWEFNGSFFPLARAALGDRAAAKLVGAALLAALSLRTVLRMRRGGAAPGALPAHAVSLLGLFLVVSPTVHPWYVCWLVPFAAMARSRAWLLLSGTIALSYVVVGDYRATSVWKELGALRFVEYGIPFAAGLVLAFGDPIERLLRRLEGKAAIVLFAKHPRAGEVKTRMTPPLAPEEAAALSRCLTSDALSTCRRVPGAAVRVAYDPPGARPSWLRAPALRWRAFDSAAGGLGEKLRAAQERHFSEGFSPVALVGSDHPTLPAQHIEAAIRLVAAGSFDLVLVPADDGGYAVLCAARPHAALFRGIPWSTAGVVAATLARARGLGLSVGLLPSVLDVDTPRDLVRLAVLLRRPAYARLCPKTARFLARRAARGGVRARPGGRTPR